jgi:hypothetical protein
MPVIKTQPNTQINPPDPTTYRQIEILGNVVNIQWVPARIMSGAYGEQDFDHHEIRIQDQLKGIQCLDTICHETFHYISDLLKLELTETQVHNLGMAWASVFMANPELVGFIAERCEEEDAKRTTKTVNNRSK